MRYLTRSNLNLVYIMWIENFKKAFLSILLVIALLLITPAISQAKLQFSQGEDGESISRSLESLRDLDYQTWQVVVYSKNPSEGSFVLRIVGYPGTLRMDHPTSLEVHAGLRNWFLKDITLSNLKLASDPREAAAEFDLSPLINDLTNNRPLRFMLPGVFSDLPVPPYVVSEWRSLLDESVLDEKS